MSRQRYEALVANSEIYFRGPQARILRTNDDNLVKLFRPRRLLSSAWLYPQNLRFARNAQRLRALSIPSVNVTQTYFVPAERLFLAVYPMLKGEALLSEWEPRPIDELARFLVRLHHKGVYFRALHLGNVLRLQDGRFALIDVMDVVFKSRPLDAAERYRNFQHLFRREDCKHWFGLDGALQLIDTYDHALCDLPEEKRQLGGLVADLKQQVRDNFEVEARPSAHAFTFTADHRADERLSNS